MFCYGEMLNESLAGEMLDERLAQQHWCEELISLFPFISDSRPEW